MSKLTKMFFMMLMLSALLAFNAFAELVMFNDGEPGVFVNVIESNPQSTTLEFEFNGFDQEEVEIDGETYLFVITPEATPLMESGKPQLFYLRQSIIIPDMANTTYEILESEYQTIETTPIIPSKGHFDRTIAWEDVPYTFDEVYESDENFPAANITLDSPYILRDFRGQTVCFNPMQYNPAREELYK